MQETAKNSETSGCEADLSRPLLLTRFLGLALPAAVLHAAISS